MPKNGPMRAETAYDRDKSRVFGLKRQDSFLNVIGGYQPP